MYWALLESHDIREKKCTSLPESSCPEALPMTAVHRKGALASYICKWAPSGGRETRVSQQRRSVENSVVNLNA